MTLPRTGWVLGWFVLSLASLVPAQKTQLPSFDAIKKQQALYQAERARIVKDGIAKRFLPVLFDKAEEIAKRGEAALAEGRLLQASEAFRQARWQLPYQAPQVPDHVSRILGNLRLRHGQEINSLAFSPDGARLATAGKDRSVKIWDLGNGHELLTYHGHSDHVRFVVFSPDGKSVVSAGAEKNIKVWDPGTGKDIRTIAGQGIYATALVFSHDGKYIIAGHNNRSLCFYETDTGNLKREIQDFQTYQVHSLSLSQDGNVLAGGVTNGQVRLWELPKTVLNANQPDYWQQNDPTGATHFVVISPDNRTLVRGGADGLKLYNFVLPGAPFQATAPRRVIAPPSPTVRYTCATFSKDGKTLFTGGSDGVIRLFDPESGQGIGAFKGHIGEIRSLVFNPAGSQLASASADYTVRLWDFDVVLQARDYLGHAGAVWSSALSPDGQLIVSASADKSVRVWEVAGSKVIHTFTGHKAPVTVALFTRDGKSVLSAGGDKVLHLWDAFTGKIHLTFAGHQAVVTGIDISRDGKRFVSSGADRHAKIWDAASGKETLDIDARSVVAAVAFSPDGKQLATGTVDQFIRLWDAVSGKLQAEWSAHGTAVSGLSYSPNGQYLASCGADPLVRVWPLATPGDRPITLVGHDGPLSSVAFRNDSQHLVSGGSDLVVKLWKIDNGVGKEAQSYRGHREWITSVAFSRDGFYIVSSGVDRTVKLWEITSREIPLLSEHTGAVEAVAFSPDGTRLASGGTDKTIKIWDRATGAELLTLTGHAEGVIALAFAPDGKTLISSSLDRTIRAWDLDTGKERPRTQNQNQNWAGFLHPVPALGLTPDGKALFAWEPGNERFNKINAYELASVTETFTFNDQGRTFPPPGIDNLRGLVAFSADGKTCAIGSLNGSIRLFDLDNKGQILPGGDWFLFDKTSVTSLDLSRDGSLLAAGDETGEVRIGKTAQKALLHAFDAHPGKVARCVISPDGKRLATVGLDNVVKLWDLAGPKILRQWDMRMPIQERGCFIADLAFSPDGKQLATANANTTLFLLDLP